jgi:hypothetical protein
MMWLVTTPFPIASDTMIALTSITQTAQQPCTRRLVSIHRAGRSSVTHVVGEREAGEATHAHEHEEEAWRDEVTVQEEGDLGQRARRGPDEPALLAQRRDVILQQQHEPYD